MNIESVFTCPQCGSHKLEEVMVAVYPDDRNHRR